MCNQHSVRWLWIRLYKILSDYFPLNFYVLHKNKAIGHLILTFKKLWFKTEIKNRLVQVSKFQNFLEHDFVMCDFLCECAGGAIQL